MQEPVPQGQERPALAGRRRRGPGRRHEGFEEAHRIGPSILRPGGGADRGIGGRARIGHALRRDQRYRPSSEGGSRQGSDRSRISQFPSPDQFGDDGFGPR